VNCSRHCRKGECVIVRHKVFLGQKVALSVAELFVVDHIRDPVGEHAVCGGEYVEGLSK